ncbi:hypothetical protein PTKIN_Ptkin02bG0256300 [Pterospermum kingtungense]
MGARPVLNYSIQTGSESGFDIFMITTVERPHPQEFERKTPYVHEEQNYYDSLRSVPRFGGKILPRPSDGKLRYVGGETRIIRLSRDISWQELVKKTLAIYNEAHTIMYQLPEEDIDALVSVSCDEDLQNMIEECNVLENGASQKPMIFLFSSTYLEDAQYGLGSIDGDSEIQYVVAVNGMDLGSRKNSIAASASNNQLDELLGLNVVREADRTVTEAAATSTAFLTANAPSSVV